MKYNVTVETRASGAVVTVEADSEDEAKQKAEAQANENPNRVADFTATHVELVV